MGSTNDRSAAISAFIAVTQFHPDVIVNAGTAGGFRKYGAAIGDAWIGTQFFNHDRRIPIPGFDVYGKGGYAAFPTPNLVSVRFVNISGHLRALIHLNEMFL